MKLRPALAHRKTFAMPTFFASGGTNSGAGGVTYALPASFQADDIHILIVEHQESETLSVPAGWAHVTGSPVSQPNGDATELNVMWRRAQGGDANVLVAAPGDHQIGVVLGFRGCRASGDPWDASTSGILSATATPTIPGVTTIHANSLILVTLCYGTDDTGSNLTGWTNATLSSFTEWADQGTITNNGGGIGAASGGLAAIGSSGNASVTIDFSATTAYLVLALSGHPVP